MTIHAKTARTEARAISLFATALDPATLAAVVSELTANLEAAVWPSVGESAGGVSGGGTGNPTAARAGSRAYREAITALDEIERHLRSTIVGIAYLTRLAPTVKPSTIEAAKVRCGDMTPDDIRRDDWYAGDVAACTENAEFWTRADGRESVRTSGLCVKHRFAWDAEQRDRARDVA